MRKIVSIVLTLMLTVTLLAACSGNSSPSNTNNNGGKGNNGGSSNSENQAPADNSAGKSNKHAIVFKNTGNPYGEKMIEGFKDAVAELGHEFIEKAPDQPTAEAQIQIMLMMNEDFIMEETADKIEMLTVLQSIILNCDLEFTGNKAVLYDRFCEIFEEIELLND